MGNKSARLAAENSVGPLGPTSNETIVQAITNIAEGKLMNEAESGIETGDKFFVSAIIHKDNLTVVASNRDRSYSENPTASAELNTIEMFFRIDKESRPKVEDCIFFSLYEPSSVALCLLAISGFNNFVYLFNREEAAGLEVKATDDISVEEIFGRIGENKYQPKNTYWTSFCLLELMEQCANKENYFASVDGLREKCQQLAKVYQEKKAALAPCCANSASGKEKK